MIICILNQSTRVTNIEAAKMAAAIQIQMDAQVAPAWDRLPPLISFCAHPGDLQAGSPVLNLKDAISEPGALGYHTEGADGSYWGDIAVNPVLDNGGGVLDGGTSGYSVASVLSHEVIELFCDASVNDWADGPTTNQGSCYALEACDPVEGGSYMVALPDGTNVLLSNWVTPKWFDEMAPAGSMFDWMKQVSKPFALASGGYFVCRKSPGNEQEVFGESMPPFWRLAQKAGNPTSRTSRRKAWKHRP